MESLQGQNAITEIGSKDKVPDHTYFAEVEVDCRQPGYQIEGTTSGYLLNGGKSTVFLAARNIEKLKGDVESEPELITQAHELFENKIDKELSEKHGGELSKNGLVFTPQVAKAIRVKAKKGEPLDENERAATDRRQAIYRKTGLSWQRCFYEANNRPVKPLLGYRVVSDKLVHPDEARKQRFQVEQSAATAAAVAAAIADRLPAGGRSAKA